MKAPGELYARLILKTDGDSQRGGCLRPCAATSCVSGSDPISTCSESGTDSKCARLSRFVSTSPLVSSKP